MSVVDRRRERLRWQCRRGMLELDLLLASVFERHYDKLTEAERGLFDSLLSLDDPTLLSFMQDAASPTDPELKRFVEKLR